MIDNIRGNLIINQERFCVISNDKCFGILIDNNTVVEIDIANDYIYHKNRDYSLIATHLLTKERFLQLLPQRKYSNDEIATVNWYVKTIIKNKPITIEPPFTNEEVIWMINELATE